MMTLDEAIKHCDEVAEELEEEAVKGCCDDSEIMDKCIECANEHRQLAEWLRELKAIKDIYEEQDKKIDDMRIDNRSVYERFYWEVWKILEGSDSE